MKAVILAAGLGSRMQEAFPSIPKPLLPLKENPIIQDQVEHLKKFGIKNFYINLHFLPNKIVDFLGDGSKFGVNISYSFENELQGTSGALNNFKDYLDKTFIVLYGDIFTRLDFNKFIYFHKDKKSHASLLIHETDHPEDSDLVEINDDNQIVNIYNSPHQSTPPTTLSNAAIYILEPFVFQYLQKGYSDFMEGFFSKLLNQGLKMYGYVTKEYSKDIGTPKRYKQVLEDINMLKL